MHLGIADDVFEEHPSLVLAVLVVRGLDNSTDIDDIGDLLRAEESALSGKIGETPVSQHPLIAPWREAYRKFGAKPKKYPSSIENLVKRVLKGCSIAHINNLVALYNVISLRHILPVGGEDLDKIEGEVWLSAAGENELPVRLLGEREARPPYPNEIIYKDSVGTICRRWNWKEADRTKLTRDTRDAFLVIEGLPPATRGMISIAVAELAGLVEKHCGGNVRTVLLDTVNRVASL